MQKIELIVFDWDGTLMDSTAAIVAAMQRAYGDCNETAPLAGAIREIIGLGLDEAVFRLSSHLNSTLRREIVTAYRRNYAQRADDPDLFAGVRETLDELRSQGFSLAVATGKSKAGLARALAATGLESIFDTTRTGEETESKPSPVMLHEILFELDIEPNATVMLGDTEFDLAMARAAKTHCAGVAYGAHAPTRFAAYNPIFILDDFFHLTAALNALDRSKTLDNAKEDPP